jgi:hypothetical protein
MILDTLVGKHDKAFCWLANDGSWCSNIFQAKRFEHNEAVWYVHNNPGCFTESILSATNRLKGEYLDKDNH